MRRFLAFLLILTCLSACTSPAQTPVPSNASASPAPTLTNVPTAGPTPTPAPPLVILVLPADLNEEESQAYQAAVYDLAQAAGFRFQVRNQLGPEDLEPALKIVIALPPDPGLAALAAAAPQTQFLAVNIPGIQAGGNISILGGDSIRPDQVAFLAGYIGAMVTEDFYQVGAMLKKDSPEAPIIQRALTTGRTYYCGRCLPIGWYTRYTYPAFVEVPADAKTSEYSAYADFLIVQKKVETLFIQAGLDTPELLQYLATVGVLMIGTQSPPKKVNGWVVTLQPDYLAALRAAFPELAAGNGGRTFSAPLSFSDINPELFTPGKQADARRVLEDVLRGYIDTGGQ
ncbi:MAG: hypothetical protein N2117_14305 [Anaerolineales bacterium]|nr:hypothetical protein [Anaerolineales bacterium]MCX7756397.1 hypothetical protein [Anaerolineales bacterium]MDW8279515.1 hypothetical protein [Anaerolineales bacterium]